MYVYRMHWCSLSGISFSVEKTLILILYHYFKLVCYFTLHKFSQGYEQVQWGTYKFSQWYEQVQWGTYKFSQWYEQVQWGTYRTYKLVTQLGLRAVNTSGPLPCYAAFIYYIQQLLTHVVYVPYIHNSWSLKEIKDELKKEINSVCKRITSAIMSQARVVYQRPLVIMYVLHYILIAAWLYAPQISPDGFQLN